MLKKFILVAVTIAFFVFQLAVDSAAAFEVDANVRTVKLNEAGDQVTLDLKEIKRGQEIFVQSCAVCHKSGTTKTNPNVNLGLESLANAEPPRDNLVAMVDYLKNPTTYDGENYLYELHPNTTRSDLYLSMRNLTEDDLRAVSGYVLIQPNIRTGRMWGGGKVYN